MGWICERGMHRYLVLTFPCAVGTVFKNEQGWLGTQDPHGPDHPPRPLTQERKMAHPSSWALCSPSMDTILLSATLSRW